MAGHLPASEIALFTHKRDNSAVLHYSHYITFLHCIFSKLYFPSVLLIVSCLNCISCQCLPAVQAAGHICQVSCAAHFPSIKIGSCDLTPPAYMLFPHHHPNPAHSHHVDHRPGHHNHHPHPHHPGRHPHHPAGHCHHHASAPQGLARA